MLIHIRRENGAFDDVDESALVKAEGLEENDNEITQWVEYRFPDSDAIVHRSVHVRLKRWPEGLGAVVQPLG